MSRRRRVQAELELLPVMNLVTILIPMLLLGAQLANLGIIDSQLPAISPDGKPEADPPLSLTVAITAAGFTVLGADGVLRPASADEDEDEGVSVPCAGTCASARDYDYAELSRLLSLVKDEFPEEQTVVLTPASTVVYEVLIGAMDATRAHGERPLFPQVSIAGGAIEG